MLSKWNNIELLQKLSKNLKNPNDSLVVGLRKIALLKIAPNKVLSEQ